jgi:hypothetical protein
LVANPASAARAISKSILFDSLQLEKNILLPPRSLAMQLLLGNAFP